MIQRFLKKKNHVMLEINKRRLSRVKKKGGAEAVKKNEKCKNFNLLFLLYLRHRQESPESPPQRHQLGADWGKTNSWAASSSLRCKNSLPQTSLRISNTSVHTHVVRVRLPGLGDPPRHGAHSLHEERGSSVLFSIRASWYYQKIKPFKTIFNILIK